MLGGFGVRSSSHRPDPQWLAARVARLVGASQVTLEERLQSLWGGYGELWRAKVDGSVSVIVKHVQPPPNDRSLSHRRKLRSYAVEEAFYRLHAARAAATPGCRVPLPLGLLSETSSWLFVLEDLDGRGFFERRARVNAVELAQGLRWLARFHALFMNETPSHLWPVGTYWQLGTRPDELRAMRHDALQRAAPSLDAKLNQARFKTLVHGDAKLENMCFSPGGEVALVDFQYAGGGVGVKDVAYFLHGCLTARQCEAELPSYLDDYFRELRLALTQGGSIGAASEIEREWRELFPLAWLDFYRFLLGWAPGQFDRDPYSERLARELLPR